MAMHGTHAECDDCGCSSVVHMDYVAERGEQPLAERATELPVPFCSACQSWCRGEFGDGRTTTSGLIEND